MLNDNDKYPARPGFEPGPSRLQAPVDTNEPSGPGTNCLIKALSHLGDHGQRSRNARENMKN